MARDMAVRIKGFVGQAQNHPHFAPYGPLRAGVDDLLRGAERLLQATCTVCLDALVEAVAEGAAGADQLGGAEEAEAEGGPGRRGGRGGGVTVRPPVQHPESSQQLSSTRSSTYR